MQGGRVTAVPGASGDAAVEGTGVKCYCDAAMMAVGLAGTALPFASSHGEEAERWLRVLRVSGAVGNAMQAIGIPEEPLTSGGSPVADARRPDALEAVIEAAQASVRAREASAIGTADLLVGVKETYGAALDHALAIRGTTLEEVFERMEAADRRRPGYGSI
jgi:hypothetical protein